MGIEIGNSYKNGYMLKVELPHVAWELKFLQEGVMKMKEGVELPHVAWELKYEKATHIKVVVMLNSPT